MAPSNGTTSTQPSHTTNGTQQWHHVHSPKVGRHPPPNHSTLQWHPTKAPSNGTTSTAPCNGTQQLHHVHSTIAHYYGASNGNQQWHHVHSTIAHYNGTLQWHPAMAQRPLKHSTLQWHPAMAPRNGTTSTAPCNSILVPRPMRKTGSSPSPLIGSKNPYSYRYLGEKKKQMFNNKKKCLNRKPSSKIHSCAERDAGDLANLYLFKKNDYTYKNVEKKSALSQKGKV